jgi:HTH-type transcriptional regulator / antitoxin HigA
MNSNIEFQPDRASPPGETIADILEERNLLPAEFARRIGHTLPQTRDLLDGRQPISNDLARKLEQVLGASAAFWTQSQGSIPARPGTSSGKGEFEGAR